MGGVSFWNDKAMLARVWDERTRRGAPDVCGEGVGLAVDALWRHVGHCPSEGVALHHKSLQSLTSHNRSKSFRCCPPLQAQTTQLVPIN